MSRTWMKGRHWRPPPRTLMRPLRTAVAVMRFPVEDTNLMAALEQLRDEDAPDIAPAAGHDYAH